MDDQANDLRRLAVRSARPDAPARGRPARLTSLSSVESSSPEAALVVLSAGKGGVGTTTLAVNLAVAVAQRHVRTMLIDADAHGGHASILCGLRERDTLADVLCGRRPVAEVLQTGPCNLQVLPGAWGLEKAAEYPPAATERLLGQLQDGELAEVIVLDAGNSPSRMVQRFWQAADLVLTVTSVEAASILDTYESIKILAKQGKVGELHCLVNLAPSAAAAKEAYGRLAQVCQRFLGLKLKYCGRVPADPQVASAGRARQAFMVAAARGEAAQQVRRLAKWLAATVARKRGAVVPAAAKHLPQLSAHCDANP